MTETTRAKRPASPRPSIDLDALYDPTTTARWMGIARRTLMDNVRLGKVPVVKVNGRLLRFHPRTILKHAGQSV